jgi:hypothetical protein
LAGCCGTMLVVTLEEELAALSAEHRQEAQARLEMRPHAVALARELGADPDDVFHQLQQLARTRSERLRLRLAHGRLRRLAQ